ncbi:VOC family protein [Streptacidiphilus carbonis]|jgi:predicted enzyme related to lactoylglutathione lyase|uniref:VOC family protein n=1 Tax=Streptacidiphilus carbonis TaxID=105422 RepID=UPI0005AB6C11|nr:VOC family protein [Streptacidiphilus carbonis]
MAPSTTTGVSTIIYPVKDLAAAKALFTALLGTEPAQDAPYYVGFEVGGQTFGLNPHGHASGMTGPVGYFDVEDIKASLQALVEAGATVQQDVQDVGGGKLIATVLDADGNPIGLAQNPS